MMPNRFTLLIALTIAATAGGSALAAKPAARTVAPTPPEAAAVIKAFGDPRAAAPCLNVRLAASNRRYATVHFRTSSKCSRWAFNGVNVFERTRDDHWKVVFEGSSYSCPRPGLPRQVQRDLGVCR